MEINYKFDSKYGKFEDTLYLPDDHTYTQEQIKEIQQSRFNLWLQTVENPSSNPFTEINGVLYEKIDHEGQLFLKPFISPVLTFTGENSNG